MGSPDRSTTLLRNWRLKPLAAAIVAAGAFGSGDDRAASLVVGTLAEQSASACTLRDALDSVNDGSDRGQCVSSGTYGSNDLVAFAPGLSGTITFFNRDPLSNAGDPSALVVQRSVAVQGPGSTQLSLACANVFYRLLEIDASALSVSLSGVTLSGCTTRGAGGGVRVSSNVAQSVQFTDVTLTVAGNPATSDTLSTELPGNVLPWNIDYSVIGVPGNIDLVGTGNITGAAVPPPFGASGWLGALQNNGGPTQTHALLIGVPDPAVDAGDPTFSGLAYDQRGPPFLRIQNHRVDIGAYEVQSTGPVGAVPVPGPGRIALSLLAGLLGLLSWRRRRG